MEDIFIGFLYLMLSGCIYGGQVFVQVFLVVECIFFEDCVVYFMYGYFLCFGDVDQGIMIVVDWIYDGCLFFICCMQVYQNGVLIFFMIVLFQDVDLGVEYVELMLLGIFVLEDFVFDEDCVQGLFVGMVCMLSDCVVDIWYVDFLLYLFSDDECVVWQVVWMRFCVLFLDDQWLYCVVLVYLSDMIIQEFILWVYGVFWLFFGFKVVSFDYVMWWYCFVCVDEWFLYFQELLNVWGG